MIAEVAKTVDVAELEEEESPEVMPDLEERESVDSVADFDEDSGDAVSVALER